MPPPGRLAAPTRRNCVFGGKDTAISAALVTHYVHMAASDPACQQLGINQINRAVRRFLAEGLAERDLVSYVVGYADPTGETAVRNIMRERRAS